VYKGRVQGGCDVAGGPELAAMEDFDLRGAAEGHSDGEVERVLRPSALKNSLDSAKRWTTSRFL